MNVFVCLHTGTCLQMCQYVGSILRSHSLRGLKRVFSAVSEIEVEWMSLSMYVINESVITSGLTQYEWFCLFQDSVFQDSQTGRFLIVSSSILMKINKISLLQECQIRKLCKYVYFMSYFPLVSLCKHSTYSSKDC